MLSHSEILSVELLVLPGLRAHNLTQLEESAKYIRDTMKEVVDGFIDRLTLELLLSLIMETEYQREFHN